MKMNFKTSTHPLIKLVNLFFNSENETGVSDSQDTHGDLPLVRTTECEATKTDTSTSESEHGTLENRIDSENECSFCGGELLQIMGSKKKICSECEQTF